MSRQSTLHDNLVWWHAFGYFACYVPYSGITKVVSAGHWPGFSASVAGLVLLPGSALVSMVGMFTYITIRGWWRFASQRAIGRLRVPVPTASTFVSGICTSVIIVTTTLAYTFPKASVLLMMLLMRGGVLILAPIVDAASGRSIMPRSWVALGLAVASVMVAGGTTVDGAVGLGALADVALYLGAYFFRLRLMTGQAKTSSTSGTLRYFVEEQMVATPAAVVMLACVAMMPMPVGESLREGFGAMLGGPLVIPLIAIGLLSQGTGIFGGLVLLHHRENAFCVTVNRASSVLAGLCATALLGAFGFQGWPPWTEGLGAAIMVTAIVVLSRHKPIKGVQQSSLPTMNSPPTG